MKNAIGQYLLAAMAADAAFVARDQSDYDMLAHFGQTAASADHFANLCNGDDACSAQTLRKIRNFLHRNSFGHDEWYRRALEGALDGKTVELEDIERSRKAVFDDEFRKLYETEPPPLME